MDWKSGSPAPRRRHFLYHRWQSSTTGDKEEMVKTCSSKSRSNGYNAYTSQTGSVHPHKEFSKISMPTRSNNRKIVIPGRERINTKKSKVISAILVINTPKKLITS
mmetsp:Transcript_2140/g.3211  ORF Transcript_2140/g.3211 Transcript_2140/m.3211 type:complete len:106 (+) Transcript_2140:205-522(+)|eukprot:CAMPEP_0197255018 /NCGR_PEP_ID=MMETSP1429-20130617/70751_1 /TAXON_ID=49237 /ORGANISM="Chaetoceros  sp., Strain UNC1202" /LENGTH=105 /DNA_ID=CAMNT_0042718179 /DNA_START=72 /DNA_END=389 /DNA_ORIENTATION=-